FMPIVLFAIIFALVISEPTGIPLTPPVLLVNGINIAVALVAWFLLRKGRIGLRWAHALGSVAWLLTLINTLVSVGLTDAPTLVLPMMIELAALALIIDTRWA